MIALRRFFYVDIPVLKEHGYENYSYDELKNVIDKWDSNIYNNLYFEMFAIVNSGQIVGNASLYQRSKSIIGCGLEIYPNHRRKGYAFDAYSRLLDIAKERGYKIAVAQVSTENAASIALNRKLGFESEDYVYVNERGEKVYYFIKSIQ